jgi:hypothetical protein
MILRPWRGGGALLAAEPLGPACSGPSPSHAFCSAQPSSRRLNGHVVEVATHDTASSSGTQEDELHIERMRMEGEDSMQQEPAGPLNVGPTSRAPRKRGRIGVLQNVPAVATPTESLASAVKRASRVAPSAGIKNEAERERNRAAKQVRDGTALGEGSRRVRKENNPETQSRRVKPTAVGGHTPQQESLALHAATTATGSTASPPPGQ